MQHFSFTFNIFDMCDKVRACVIMEAQKVVGFCRQERGEAEGIASVGLCTMSGKLAGSDDLHQLE